MNQKTMLITGATDGIGKATAQALAMQGHTVILHGRNAARGQAAVDELKKAAGHDRVDFMAADLSSLREVRQLAAAVQAKYAQLHVLINNAGVFMNERQLTEDGFEMTFAVNHLAPFLLTQQLLPLLRQSAPARIITVSSVAHQRGRINFDDLQSERAFNGYRAYAHSKLANVLFTFELAARLAGAGVTANCLHPGVIGTKLLQTGFGIGGATPAEGARTSVYLASAPEVETVTGAYFDDLRAVHSAPQTHDETTRRRLWEISEQLCQ